MKRDTSAFIIGIFFLRKKKKYNKYLKGRSILATVQRENGVLSPHQAPGAQVRDYSMSHCTGVLLHVLMLQPWLSGHCPSQGL